MNIGIDIDDTIVFTTEPILKYADIYNSKVLGKEEISKDIGQIKDRFYLQTIYGWDEKTKTDFFQKYYLNVLLECKLMKDVTKVLNKLKQQGHKLFYITARISNIKGCDAYKITKYMLDENNIPYDLIVMDAYEKLSYARDNNIDLFIEDSFETCEELEKNGIKTLLMTSLINKDIDTGKIDRVYNWNEVYTKICDFKNIKEGDKCEEY